MNPLRKLPSVAAILARPELAASRGRHPAEAVTQAVRDELEHLRDAIRADTFSPDALDPAAVAQRVLARLDADAAPTLRTVINATGIVMHTNLGRSVLSDAAAEAATGAARGYINLELDLRTGKRHSRQAPVRDELRRLLGCEAATAVNNCAAATVVTLRALAAGKEVVVSRGQLVEIGGGFRIPEIMAVSGATLREVGTTNITRIADYAAAVGPHTGLLLRVHASNFRVRGFTKAVALEEMIALGHAHDIPVVDDVGSGAALDLAPFGLPGEPLAAESLRAGADLVLFSGDKLLGGPQCGVIAGRKELVDRIERDPLFRAVRLDKMTLAALVATLRQYRDPARARRDIPTLRMLTTPIGELRERCRALAARLLDVPGLATVEVRDDTAFAGGGSLPDVAVPTAVIALTARGMSEDALAAALRSGTPAVVGRVQGGAVLLDLRAVLPHQEDDLVVAVAAAAGGN